MRSLSRTAAIAVILLLCAAALGACASSGPEPPSEPIETAPSANLDAAIATATKSANDASTYIFGLAQSMENPPSGEDLDKVLTTLELASTQTGAAQRATAQSALDQFNTALTNIEAAQAAAPQDQATQDQYEQLITTVEIGRDALDAALK
jgi:hypothetical protein